MHKPYDFFFLDLDDTLYPYSICHESGLNGFIEFASSEFKLEKEKVKETYKQVRKEINTRLHGFASSHSRLLYAKEFCEAFGLNPVQYAIPLANSYWESYFPKLVLGDGVLAFLQELKKREKKIGLITDLTTEIQLKKLAFLKIDSYFDVIITSEEAGAEKPNPRIFELAIKKLNAQKLSSIMIGDNYEKDVLGARKFGISSYYFGFREDEEFCLRSFTEALDKLL